MYSLPSYFGLRYEVCSSFVCIQLHSVGQYFESFLDGLEPSQVFETNLWMCWASNCCFSVAERGDDQGYKCWQSRVLLSDL